MINLTEKANIDSIGDEQRGWVAKMKWNFLVTYVDLLHKIFEGSLKDFKTPKLEIGVLFYPPNMDVWYKNIDQRFIWDCLDHSGYVRETFTLWQARV